MPGLERVDHLRIKIVFIMSEIRLAIIILSDALLQKTVPNYKLAGIN
jgi:hypothetical protein